MVVDKKSIAVCFYLLAYCFTAYRCLLVVRAFSDNFNFLSEACNVMMV